jgi:hypothetical protein
LQRQERNGGDSAAAFAGETEGEVEAAHGDHQTTRDGPGTLAERDERPSTRDILRRPVTIAASVVSAIVPADDVA